MSEGLAGHDPSPSNQTAEHWRCRWFPSGTAGLLTLLLALALPCSGRGQLPDPDPGDLGWGGATTATARGFAAVAANPAALGVEQRLDASLAILTTGWTQGFEPIGFGDIRRWDNREVPREVREAWLARVERSNAQAGVAAGDLTWLAFARGRFGLQLSTRAAGTMSLNRDAVELVLFGNAGRTGEPRDFRLDGSRGDGHVVTTVGIAHGVPAGRLAGGRLYLGATLTLSLGHALVVARDNGTAFGGDPIELDLRFPVIHVDGGARAAAGHGVGLDVGALWSSDRWSVGAAMANVVQSFTWRLSELVFRPGSALFDATTSETDFEERAAREAPPVLLDAVRSLGLPPVVSLGLHFRPSDDWALVLDVESRLSPGARVGPRHRLTFGGEREIARNLRGRLGVSAISGGLQLSGGVGYRWRRVTVSGALASRTGSLDNALLASFGLAFGGGG